MRHDDSYKKFQDRMFQKLDEMERLDRERIVEEFVKWAEIKGFLMDELLRMLDSGMSPSGIFSAVKNK